jgi:phosphinothricin acetyltransferase
MPAAPSRLRDARPEEAGVIAEIYNESIAAGDSTMDDEPKHEDEVRRQMAGFSDREGYLVLEAEGRIAGWGIIKRYSDRPGYRFCCETSVYVRRALLGRGYGTQIQQGLLAWCRAHGFHHVVARIMARNRGSIRLHEKLGFGLVGVQQEIGYRNGQWEDVVVMQRLLDPEEG